jgi:hypothetical protein
MSRLVQWLAACGFRLFTGARVYGIVPSEPSERGSASVFHPTCNTASRQTGIVLYVGRLKNKRYLNFNNFKCVSSQLKGPDQGDKLSTDKITDHVRIFRGIHFSLTGNISFQRPLRISGYDDSVWGKRNTIAGVI